MPDKNRPTILIIDDNEGIRDILDAILAKNYPIYQAEDGKSGLKIISEKEIRIVLLDIMLPDLNGLDLLSLISDRYPEIDTVMITALKDVETAVKAMKLGAYDYITKGFEPDEIENLIKNIEKKQQDKKELLYLRSEIEQLIDTNFVVGKTAKMREISSLVKKVSRLPATVLIQGESGTGKQLLARFIHQESDRRTKPFVTVDLGAIPDNLVESTLFGHERGAFTGAYRQHIGKFELADRGTLFLDEINNLRVELQGKLLRAIQEGEIERVGGTKTIHVSPRLIVATNIDLTAAVQNGHFREDLFYRLNVIPIRIPSLRERLVDLPQLVEFFRDRYTTRFNKEITQVSKAALDVLSAYHWPGNIRELENLIERLVAVVEGETIDKEHIPMEYYFHSLQKETSQDNILQGAADTFERNFILKTLQKEKWNRKSTAEALGIPLSTLKFKFKKHNLYDLISTKKREKTNRKTLPVPSRSSRGDPEAI